LAVKVLKPITLMLQNCAWKEWFCWSI